MLLDKEKVEFSEASLVDDFGRVFFYNDRIFRAVFHEKDSFCRSLISSPLFKHLIEQEIFPRTWITDYSMQGYALILEHEKIDESRPHHWSFSMYRDAAILLLKANEICNKYGYELKDAHPYNIFFSKLKPVFIDIGSIVEITNKQKWTAYQQFINSFYIQLLVWMRRDFFLARRLIEDGVRSSFRTIPMSPILNSLFIDSIASELFEYNLHLKGRLILSTSQNLKLIRYGIGIVNRVTSFFGGKHFEVAKYERTLKPLAYIQDKIRGMKRPFTKSIWGTYHNAYKKEDQIVISARFLRIIDLVKKFAPDVNSCIDLAGNQGIFSSILYKTFTLKRVSLTDYDEQAIDIAYHSFREQNLNINVHLFNFMKPVRQDEVEMLKSDIVFALAITHHLILSQNYLLPVILKTIGAYSKRYVVIEFMPKGLWSGNDDEKVNELPVWYSVDWFAKGFKDYFHLLAQEKIEENRIVFIGEIRSDDGDSVCN